MRPRTRTAGPATRAGWVLVLALVAAPALAQDDDPWTQDDEDTTEGEGAPPDEAPEDGPEPPPAEAPPEGMDAEADPMAEGEPPPDGGTDGPPPGVDRSDTVDPEIPLAGGQVVSGLRIAPYGAGTGAGIGQALVLFANGNTTRSLVHARYASGRWGVQVSLPVAFHDLPRQPRTVGLGNLQLDVWRRIGDDADSYTGLGLELHGNLGERTWTWLHETDEIWPGFGADLVVQRRQDLGAITTMARLAFGVRSHQDYAPLPPTTLHFEVVLGADVAMTDRFGLVGEMSASWWDLSPWDFTGFVRADLLEGVRVRGGVVLPLGVWAGVPRIDEDFRGVREATALMDLSIAL